MNTKTIFSILGLLVVIVAIVLIARGNKDSMTTEDSLEQQTMLEGTQDSTVSPEDLAAQAALVEPVVMPPVENQTETGEPAPSFPQTGFPETE